MASFAFSPSSAVTRPFSGAIKTATRSVRWTVIISLLLIFGSFVSAAIIQMRLDRIHALDQARAIETRRAVEMASDSAQTFDRYASLGIAFANAEVNAETSAALSEAGGAALTNIAVLDQSGRLFSEMNRPPTDLLPLDPGTLSSAAAGRAVVSIGSSIVLAFSVNRHIVLVQLNRAVLLPFASMEDAVLAGPQGSLLAIGRNWRDLPSATALSLPDRKTETRVLELASGRRLIALAPVPGWPVTAGASIEVGQALSDWYGALPIYFFFILGPAFAGAGLAAVFVREFERRARAVEAVRNLKSKRSEEAKLLVRLAEAERHAVEADRSKAEFLMHMSHELRTPLNAIIGFADVIGQGLFGKPGHPKYEEYARDIGDAGRALHAKIGDILEFASLDAAKQPIHLTAIDARTVAREAVEEIEGRAFSRKIRVTAELSDPARCVGDAHCLKRALNNLLSNALQYTPEGGSLQVQVHSDDTSVFISVRDTGLGFFAGEVARAGAPFARFERTGAVTGAGLGLAIASALVRRMGGALRISGKPGEGTVAELKLRRA